MKENMKKNKIEKAMREILSKASEEHIEEVTKEKNGDSGRACAYILGEILAIAVGALEDETT